MLKKIPVSALRQDMFVHELCGSWMDHPFWRSAFVLKDRKDIARLRESAVQEVWIDTSRGLDVEEQANVIADRETTEADHQAFVEAAMTETVEPGEVSMEVEVRRAAKVCAKAREAVVSMFGEARMGGVVDVGSAEPLVEEISNSVLRNPHALVNLARLRSADDYTYMHSVAVCAMMVSLGQRLGLSGDALHSAGMAGLLHDLGKAAIPLEVLNKPGPLTDAEFDLMKSHPAAGHAMLEEAGGADAVALDVCLHHHEKMSGRGYPEGLTGEAISLLARMGAVCDVYDAITSDRPYKAGWEPSNALMKMHEWSGDHFDKRVYQNFVKCVGIYPVGSLVRLDSGRLGVVTEQRTEALLKPVLKLVYCTKQKARLMPKTLDLAGAGCQDRIVDWEDPATWGLKHLEELWATP